MSIESTVKGENVGIIQVNAPDFFPPLRSGKKQVISDVMSSDLVRQDVDYKRSY